MIKYSHLNKKNKNKKKSNHKYLCYTNLLLIVSLFYFLFNIQETKNKPCVEYILASFLILTIIFSQLFWNNPIKQSKIHKIDAIIAKIVIFSFILYTLFYKFKFSYLLVLLAIATSFYFSNYYSNQEWCSNKHLFCHGSLHIFCFIATFYAFSPVLI
jgi:phosphatidylserine synthase